MADRAELAVNKRQSSYPFRNSSDLDGGRARTLRFRANTGRMPFLLADCHKKTRQAMENARFGVMREYQPNSDMVAPGGELDFVYDGRVSCLPPERSIACGFMHPAKN